jgi:hypothetical protein
LQNKFGGDEFGELKMSGAEQFAGSFDFTLALSSLRMNFLHFMKKYFHHEDAKS